MLPEMENIDGNKVATETLGGVVTKTVVEETRVSVVKVIQEGKEMEGNIVKNQENEGEMEGNVVKNQENEGEMEGNIVKKQENEKEGCDVDVVVITETVVEETEVSVKEEMEGIIVKNQENEVQEDEKEEVFGNFVGGVDEDMGVKCSNDNGVSVKGFSDGENGTEEKPVFEGDSGNLDENRDGDPMEVCLSNEKSKKHDNGAEIVATDEEKNKNDKGNVKDPMEVCLNDETIKNDEESVKENGAESESAEVEIEDESEEDHDFVTGDFVWGKIKSHPWWPGQIYDPSDASDFAAKFKRKGRLLVAYFGDGSFSWCSPSQLKSFVNHFDEMSKQSNSKNFVNAVQNALDEISRLMEAELMVVDRIESGRVVNSGIKEGVFAPKGNTIKVLIDRMGPVELLSAVKASATMEFEKLLELDIDLTVVRSCLSAFYKRKGGFFLTVFHDPKCIEGLEDKIRTGSVANSDLNGPAENTDDKLYQGRKQKSVAELLGEVENDEPKIKKAKTFKDGGSRKRKVVVVVPESPETDQEGGGEEEEEELTTPRQRKKSKYLSPPYTNPIWGGRVSAKPEPEKERDSETGDKRIEDSLKKSSGKKPRQKRRPLEESDSGDSKDDCKKIIGAALNVSKVLTGLLRAALDPSGSKESKNLTGMTDFISSFRSSNFKDGSISASEASKDSEIGLVKRKVEMMMEMVKWSEEGEISAEMKASLEEGMGEVLEKLSKMESK